MSPSSSRPEWSTPCRKAPCWPLPITARCRVTRCRAGPGRRSASSMTWLPSGSISTTCLPYSNARAQRSSRRRGLNWPIQSPISWPRLHRRRQAELAMPELKVDIVAGRLDSAAESWLDKLVAERVASALANQDLTLWGRPAQSEAARRLAWVGLPRSSRPLLATIDALRSQLHADGIDRVVLAGMGGSSPAPEVICATNGVPLTVLDTTDTGQVADALAGH